MLFSTNRGETKMLLNSKTYRKKLLMGGGLLLIVLVFSSMVFVPVSADDNGDDNGDDEIDENERELEIDVQDDTVEIESKRKYGEDQDEIEITIAVDNNEFTVELEYSSEVNTTEYDLEFEVIMDQIVEFIDETGDGVYNETEDTLVQVYEFDEFKNIEFNMENVDDVILYHLKVSTIDDVFTADVYISTTFTVVDGIEIAPSQLKIDIGIHDFPYLEDNSMLALRVDIESSAEYDIEDETEDEQAGRAENEKQILFDSGLATGFFSWIEIAIIDGVETEVKSIFMEFEEDEGEGEYELYLCYQRGDKIIHDPKIGVANIIVDDESPTGISNGVVTPNVILPMLSRDGFLITSAISAFIIVGLVIIAKKRKY